MAKIKFEEFIKFDKNNVKERLRKLPSAIYYFGQQELELEKEVVQIETKLGIVKAKLRAMKRSSLARTNNGKAPTEKRVSDIVEANPEVEELVEELDGKRELLKLSKLRMKTLYALSDAMTQYGHYIRLEKKNNRNNNL